MQTLVYNDLPLGLWATFPLMVKLMSDFEALYLAIKSEQLSASQVVDAMNNPHFMAFYKQRDNSRKVIQC